MTTARIIRNQRVKELVLRKTQSELKRSASGVNFCTVNASRVKLYKEYCFDHIVKKYMITMTEEYAILTCSYIYSSCSHMVVW